MQPVLNFFLGCTEPDEGLSSGLQLSCIHSERDSCGRGGLDSMLSQKYRCDLSDLSNRCGKSCVAVRCHNRKASTVSFHSFLWDEDRKLQCIAAANGEGWQHQMSTFFWSMRIFHLKTNEVIKQFSKSYRQAVNFNITDYL